MRKAVKNSLLEVLGTLYEAHDSIISFINNNDIASAISLLGDCQNTAVEIGSIIEEYEGEGFVTIHFLEEYCEVLYQISVKLNEGISGEAAKNKIDDCISLVKESIENDIKIRLEIVFLPYKASMWDSLESVWKAADEDPECSAFVVPIPYYDRNPDYSLGNYHYDIADFPDYVPTFDHNDYDFESHRPDVIYIHYLYDQYNKVTSIDPKYYSTELKKYTDCLIYIPYYATTGVMDSYHIQLMATISVDYFVIQSTNYIGYFDEKVFKDRLIPTGSPKFDRVINMCKNPPLPPIEWKNRMAGKKVLFFNTSIGGMLNDTIGFFNKVLFVFNTFRKRQDVCLLWRPHPLLETTMRSMRPESVDDYEKLKNYFFEHNIGIYDNTPDITASIALSDAYIGDSGTSITSLFGVVGKQMFVLDNYINSLPDNNDKHAAMLYKEFWPDTDLQWYVSVNDNLYFSENNDFNYKFVCSLSNYKMGYEYTGAVTVNGKTFILPYCSSDIIQVDKNGIIQKFDLPLLTKQAPFRYVIKHDIYIFLIPDFYPAIVRFDTQSGEIALIEDYIEHITGDVNGIRVTGGYCIYDDTLFVGAVESNIILSIDTRTCDIKPIAVDTPHTGGSMTLASDGNLVWITPFRGSYILSWNPETGKTKCYDNLPNGFFCTMPEKRIQCSDMPFSSMRFDDENVYLASYWANMCIKLNKTTGEIKQYIVPVNVGKMYKNGYYFNTKSSYFHKHQNNTATEEFFFSVYERRLFKIEHSDNSFQEIPIVFNSDEALREKQGFGKISMFLRFACLENAYNTIDDFLNDNITGDAFDSKAQIAAYSEIAENLDGTCGINTHRFIKNKLIGNGKDRYE